MVTKNAWKDIADRQIACGTSSHLPRTTKLRLPINTKRCRSECADDLCQYLPSFTPRNQRQSMMPVQIVANICVSASHDLCLNGQDLCPTPSLMADINVGHESSIVQRLTTPWDTNVDQAETQILAGGPLRDSYFGTQRERWLCA